MGSKAQQPLEYDDYGQTSYHPDERHDADSSTPNAGATPVVNTGRAEGYTRGAGYSDHL